MEAEEAKPGKAAVVEDEVVMVIDDDDEEPAPPAPAAPSPPAPPKAEEEAVVMDEEPEAAGAAPPAAPPPQITSPTSGRVPADQVAAEVAAMLAAADGAGDDDDWDDLAPHVLSPPTSGGAAAATAAPPSRPPSGPTARAPAPRPFRPQPLIDLDAELAAATAEATVARGDVRRARVASDAPTTEMFEQVQELLQLFGIPYLVAPMEAEAQAAWLDTAGLVDGVATDDNDVFLFGGRTVYRNLFADSKYVEEYRSGDVEGELGLARGDLIRLAQLLGSDYAEGVGGVGVVNAVEVLRAFPGPDGLADFRAWVDAPDDRLVGLAARAAGAARAGGGSGDAADPSAPQDPPARAEFKRRHRAARTNWQVPDNFPSPAVTEAYVAPRVDSGTAKFVQVPPAADELRAFCARAFGWAPARVDQVLAPALKVRREWRERRERERQREAEMGGWRLEKAKSEHARARGRRPRAAWSVTLPSLPMTSRLLRRQVAGA